MWLHLCILIFVSKDFSEGAVVALPSVCFCLPQEQPLLLAHSAAATWSLQVLHQQLEHCWHRWCGVVKAAPLTASLGTCLVLYGPQGERCKMTFKVLHCHSDAERLYSTRALKSWIPRMRVVRHWNRYIVGSCSWGISKPDWTLSNML